MTNCTIRKINLIFSSALLLAACSSGGLEHSGAQKIYFSHISMSAREPARFKQFNTGTVTQNAEVLSPATPQVVLRFDNDSSIVRPDDIERLQSFVLNFSAQNMPTLLISGHTDSNHDDEYNDQLSQRRTLSTQSQLKKLGVPLDHMVLQAYGETAPEADNSNAAGRQINRRVIVSIVPST